MPLQNTAHVAVLNPSKIRSKYAAFNPWRTNESNLLASHPVATALGSATLAKMLGAGQNIDLRQSINDKLSKSADPLGLYSRYGMEAPYSYGDVAQQALGATDLYAPIAAGEAIEAAKKGEWKKSGLSALGALPIIGALKASHGSPHAFTKFDFSKIGTGEGAQAYGHGGYFAQGFDSPVAKEYQDKLSTKVYMGGKRLDSIPSDSPQAQAHHSVVTAMSGQKIEPQEAINNAIKYWNDAADEMLAFEKTNPELRDRIIQEANSRRAIAKEAERLKPEDFYRDPGHLYNVELKWPDAAREASDPLGEHHLLDWDAPMSQQPSYIKKKLGLLDAPSQERMDEAISNMMAKAEKLYGDKYAWTDLPEARLWERRMGREIGRGQPDVSGAEFYRGSDTDFLHGATAPENERSQYLRSLGIPGIRYLDQGSRSAGTGSRNYVMFDDALANIVSRNGVSLTDLLPKQKMFDLSFVPEGNAIRDYKIGNSTISLDARPDIINISSIRTPALKRGQGSARNALSQLIEQADAEGIPLSLGASPLDKKTSLQKLFDFYQSMGFEPTGSTVNYLGHPEMIRYPKKR